MSENPKTLTERIETVIGEYFAEGGGGFGHAFVAAVEGTDENGDTVIVLAHPDTQGYVSSLGLCEMLTEDVRMGARQAIAARYGACDCDDCDEDD